MIRRLFFVPFAFFLLNSLQAQEVDLKLIVKKAIEAHGGEANLAKLKGTSSKFKGTLAVDGMTFDVLGESVAKLPDKFRNTLTINVAGMMIETVQIFDGKRFWVATAGETKEITDEKIVNEVREQMGADRAGGLIQLLKDPAYELHAIGETKVKDLDTFGIRVSKKGSRDVNMFFDKKTHLMAKFEMRAVNPMTGEEVTQAKYLLEYKDTQGIKSPSRVIIEKDGNPFMDLVLIEARILETIDDAQFAP